VTSSRKHVPCLSRRSTSYGPSTTACVSPRRPKWRASWCLETRRLADVDDWGPERIIKSRYNLVVGDYVDHLEPGESAVVKAVKHLQPGTEPDPEAIREEYRHEPIVQEFVPYDEEYMFAGLYDHGEALATFQHHQIRGNSYTGGGGVYRQSTDIP